MCCQGSQSKLTQLPVEIPSVHQWSDSIPPSITVRPVSSCSSETLTSYSESSSLVVRMVSHVLKRGLTRPPFILSHAGQTGGLCYLEKDVCSYHCSPLGIEAWASVCMRWCWVGNVTPAGVQSFCSAHALIIPFSMDIWHRKFRKYCPICLNTNSWPHSPGAPGAGRTQLYDLISTGQRRAHKFKC